MKTIFYSLLIGLYANVFAVSGQKCDERLEAVLQAKTFASPNFPDSYNNSLNCTWYITTKPGSQIELKFWVVDIEEEYDTLRIYDGADDSAPVLSILHGNIHVPSVILSSTGKLFLRFQSDDSVAKRGFRVQYRIALNVRINITSVIQSAVADTTLTSVTYNHDKIPREVEFKAIFPHQAYITKFVMEVDGVKFVGAVERKENVKQAYEDIQVQGITMGYVSSTKDLAKTFFTGIMLQPGKTVKFELVYQQLLQRRLGRYTNTVVLTRDYLVHDLAVDVFLCARSNLTFLQVPPMEDAGKMSYIGQVKFLGRKDFFPDDVKAEKSGNIAYISFRSRGNGRTIPVSANRVVFVVHYDVYRDDTGTLSVFGGEYFGTFFSPKIPNLVRRIVFVLDVSGSMAGNKIEQVKIAMKDILNGLSQRDSFNIVQFESVVRKWKPFGLVAATREAKRSARKYIDSFDPEGKTNIHEALLTGINLLNQGNTRPWGRPVESSPHREFVFFLGDGKPTVGVKSTDAILKAVEATNKKGFGINAIGFGKNVDIKFLQKLTREHSGKWRIIYDDQDSHVQIQNFLADLGVPIMTDVNFAYSGNQVNYTTQRKDLVLLNGGEIGVFGRLVSNMTEDVFNVTITGRTFKGVTQKFEFPLTRGVAQCQGLNVREVKEFAARGYGIAKLQETLRNVKQADDGSADALIDEATDLSLEFNLVTPVTSLVVKRESNDTNEEENGVTVDSKLPNGKGKPGPGLLISPLPGTTSPWVFEGDPHFIVALGNNITVCFTWNGTDGEIYNLLNDPVTSVTLNGLIKYGPRSTHESMKSECRNTTQDMDPVHANLLEGSENKTDVCNRDVESYFVKLGFVFAKERLKVEVTPRALYIYDEDNPKKTLVEMIPASDELLTVVRRNVGISVYNITKVHSFVNITLKNTVTFVINLKRTRNLPPDKKRISLIDHLDLDIVGHENLSPDTDGLFGLFPRNSKKFKKSIHPVARLRRPGKQNLLLYRKNRIAVNKISIADPYSKVPRECWFTYEENAVTGRADKAFKVQTIFDIPQNGISSVLKGYFA